MQKHESKVLSEEEKQAYKWLITQCDSIDLTLNIFRVD